MNTAIIIPALNPDDKLIRLVEGIKHTGDSAIIIVDDGSKLSCNSIFTKLEYNLGCIVCRHAENKGKGEALKTGIRRAISEFPELSGVVTADADGQHLPADILHIAQALTKHPHSLILGTRDFSSDNVPFKSRWGNRITSLVFMLGTKTLCRDTQTGLRGIPASLLDFCLNVPGSRFEYEMNMLTTAAHKRIPFVMLPISTVYLENNQSSHFNPIKDSFRIYVNILKFGISSLFCAIADLTLFSLFAYCLFGQTSTGIFTSTIMARCLSGGMNFAINKRWCFESEGNHFTQALKYFVLFCAQILLSSTFVTLFSKLPINLTVLKMLIDGALFVLSYFVQSRFIFKDETSADEN
ncbi:bifunctional glycosyltransferase family 2/GtrA family protein [Acetanaerobacterium elongatum]|uniref:GtrA-like protein n=1 Tax=Acetanaerobacterium elongatum TaxID=258515 RepID=A0A1H0DZM3_9FIRM|nr:bifunctional glycosyltransferase family 2/GtrA family protein [Acetanaerobacterium elongatum]SDN75575.1 GtrA-like protein [Acetanaerobacterium elongatum]